MFSKFDENEKVVIDHDMIAHIRILFQIFLYRSLFVSIRRLRDPRYEDIQIMDPE